MLQPMTNHMFNTLLPRLFAIGDIHGCFDSFKELVENKIQLRKEDKLILLGDYIDRGDKSKGVVDFIIELSENGYDVIPLMGNHEAMLLDAYKDEKYISKWIQNGGNETLKSFEISSLKKLETKYIDFYRSLKLYFEFENCLFVHAGFNDEIENPFDDSYHMIWNCRENYTHPALRDKTIIHGHCVIPFTACDDRIKNNNPVINLDTGSVYSNHSGLGRLTSLEIYTRTILFV
jgi:serine/threonine protein phosphatase 1